MVAAVPRSNELFVADEVGSAFVIRCPNCRQPSQVHPSGIASLPVNQSVVALLQSEYASHSTAAPRILLCEDTQHETTANTRHQRCAVLTCVFRYASLGNSVKDCEECQHKRAVCHCVQCDVPYCGESRRILPCPQKLCE